MRMKSRTMIVVGVLLAGLAQEARATFHEWSISQIYSNASGSVQYVDLVLPSFVIDDESHVGGHDLSAGLNSNSLTIPADLPAVPVAGEHFLVATAGFAAIAGITPDYTLPVAPFFNPAGDSLNWAFVDTFNFRAIPTDGIHARNRDGSSVINSPINFAGQVGHVPEPASWALLLIGAIALWAVRRKRRSEC